MTFMAVHLFLEIVTNTVPHFFSSLLVNTEVFVDHGFVVVGLVILALTHLLNDLLLQHTKLLLLFFLIKEVHELLIVLLWTLMNVPGDKPRNWVAMILPVFWFITVRNWTQFGRSDEHVGVEDDGTNRYQAQHGIEVEHILELVPLPSGGLYRETLVPMGIL